MEFSRTIGCETILSSPLSSRPPNISAPVISNYRFKCFDTLLWRGGNEVFSLDRRNHRVMVTRVLYSAMEEGSAVLKEFGIAFFPGALDKLGVIAGETRPAEICDMEEEKRYPH